MASIPFRACSPTGGSTSRTTASFSNSGGVIAGIALAAALAAIGFGMLFSNFAGYDDEGYILISVREYFASGQLYDEVYSQYGPAFYVLFDVFQFAFGPIDNSSARITTLLLWLGTAGLCGIFVRRETTSASLGLFTFGATFLYLYFLQDESFHPGAVIIFVLAASTAGLMALVRAGRWSSIPIVAGFTGSLLLLTKINVGLFYFAALGAWGLLNANSPRIQCAATFLVPVGLTVFAAMLMHPLWGEGWITVYIIVFAVGAVTTTYTIRRESVVSARHVATFVLAAASLAFIVLTSVWLRGTSISGLIDGIVLRPLRHPHSYSYPVDWRPGTVLLAMGSLALAGIHFHVRRSVSAHAADRILVSLRIAQAIGLLVAVALLMHARVIGTVFSYVAPLIWIFVVPLSGRKADARDGRGLLAIILLVQFLHAYPVGGSQESWGTFLFIPLLALGVSELQLRLPSKPWKFITVALSAVLTAKVAWTAVIVQRKYAAAEELRLPGAKGLHLAEASRSAYSILALNAAVHGDMLFSLPGMFSFNLWTGLPAPTSKNTTLWFTLLTDPEQREIIRSLEQASRPCIIVQELLLKMTLAEGRRLEGPLISYLHEKFVCAFRIEGFAFWVRAGREIAPINVAMLAGERIDVSILAEETSVATVELRRLNSPDSPARWTVEPNVEVIRTRINTAGKLASPSITSPLPIEVNGLMRISIASPAVVTPEERAVSALHLRDSDGRLVALVRFNE